MLLFGVERWLLLAPMSHMLEGVHMVFLQQVTKSKLQQEKYFREWRHNQYRSTWTGDREQFQSWWPYGIFLMYVQWRQDMRVGVNSKYNGGDRWQLTII